jgi:hypothetical protein
MTTVPRDTGRVRRWLPRLRRPEQTDDAAGDHLLGLLLHGSSSGGAGAYNNLDVFTTALGPGLPDSPAARLVTAHEAMHVALNDSTAFGTALAALGVLAHDQGNTEPLRSLLAMCRGVHESFATFGSIWAVSDGDLDLLAGRADYLAWYRDAADLVPLPDHSRRKELAFDAAALVCMQSPVLDDLLATGIAAKHPAVPRRHRPDARFRLLHERADAAFWARCWDRCWQETAELPGWDLLVTADNEPGLRRDTYSDELSPTWDVVTRTLYFELAGLLADQGARSLVYDGHRGRTAEVIAAVEEVVPGSRGRLIASADDAPVDLEVAEMWSRERLVVRERPRRARLQRIEDRPDVELRSVHEERLHVFVIARPAFRLLDQFDLDERDAATLRLLGSAPVVAVLSSAPEVVDLVVLSRPTHLELVLEEGSAGLGVLADVALSCLGDLAWRDRWAPALGATSLTVLIDLNPLRQIDAWRADGEWLRYALGSIGGGSAGAALFACLVGERDVPFLLPCTAIVSDALAGHLDDHYPGAERTAAVISDHADLIQVTLSHLLGAEHHFDVAAYPKGEPPHA